MSKLFKNFFIFALTLLVVASQVEAADLSWQAAHGLRSSGANKLNLIGDKLQHPNGKYVLLVEKNNIVYQGLVDDVSKATKFDNFTGDYKATFDTLHNVDLVFVSDVISTIGGLSVVSPSTSEFNIAWDANGLTFAASGVASPIYSKKFQTTLHSKFLKLVLNGTNVIQELVDNADATEITVNAGSLTFNISNTIYSFVNSSAGALAVRDESGTDFTLVPYVTLTAPSVYWTDGLSFDSIGDQLTPESSGIPIGSKYLELKLNGTEFEQILAETSGTIITDVLGNWTFSENGVDYTLVNDGNGKVVIHNSTHAHNLKPYAGPTLYWTYNLTTNPTNSVARFNPVTELICHNSSLCLRLSLNGTTIIQTFNQTSDATKFTQDLATSTWNFDIGVGKYIVTPNSTTTTVKIFDTSSNEIPVAAYTGPKLSGSSSIVTPLFYTLFITLSVVIFAL